MKINSLPENRKETAKGMLLFAGLLLIFSAALFYLYFKQCIAVIYCLPKWGSDMVACLPGMAGEDSGVTYSYPLLFAVGRFFNLFLPDYAAMAAATTLLHALAIVTAYYFIRKAVISENSSLKKELSAAAVTVALFLVTMLFDPRKIMSAVYIGSESPNVFHNATSVAAKPFAVAVFFIYCNMLRERENGIKLWEALALAGTLFLCDMAKPSYPLVFLSAAGLAEAYRLIKYKFKNIKEAAILLLCVLPTVLYMLYQNSIEFGEEAGKICFGFGTVWKAYSENIPLALLKGIAFPIAVLAFNYKELKNSFLYRFSWFQYAVGFAEYYFLYEDGTRMYHGNFGWGYQYGMFFLFMTSAITLLNSKDSKWKKLIQWIVFAMHLVCGLLYFRKLLLGGKYY